MNANGPVGGVRSYRDLLAWQMGMEMVKKVYEATAAFPKTEMFGLTQQMRRCAVSIPSNIAEGYGRSSLVDYVRFLQIARGSLYELQTQVVLAQDLKFLPPALGRAIEGAADECARVLHGLIAALKRKKAEQ